MLLRHVRNAAAAVLVVGHLVAVALVFTRLHAYLATAAEKVELVLILAPLTGLFALAGVRHILSNPAGSRSRAKASASFALVAVGIPLAFVGFIIYTLSVYPFGVAEDPDSLRMTLAATEAALGAMLGAVVEKLFGEDMDELRKEAGGG